MAEPAVPPIPAEITLLQRHQWIKRRQNPRYQCGPATPARVVDRRSPSPRRGWVLNLSAGGAGLLLSEPLEADTLIVIHLRSAAHDRFLELPARVVHSTLQVNGDWLVGCEFAERLSADDLDALLS
jgi:c-di-GMP-binding flagellar brake protein YcgR